MATTCSIDVMPVPDADDEPGLVAFAGVANAVHRDIWGTDDFRRTPRELLGTLRDDRDTRATLLRARDDAGTLLGYALLQLPAHDNTHTGALAVGVLPEHRGRGIGSALHTTAVDLARAQGRTHLTASTDQRAEPPAGPAALEPPTGEGRVDATDPGVRFARRLGWDLEQVARYSVLEVPHDDAGWARVADLRADAERRAGDEYRLLAWAGPTPDELAAQFANLQTQMSTDEPHGGFDVEPDVWDVERLRRAEWRFASQGRAFLVMCAQHVPSGDLAAYTSFLVPDDPRDFVHQYDTLVVRAHRGRRLGMLVKTANLQRLADELPAVRRIGTWNVEENRWMLAINVALGFRPSGGSGEWQLRLGGE